MQLFIVIQVVFGAKNHTIKYWSRKYSDSTFHAASHGGRRNLKFSTEKQLRYEILLWQHCKLKPCAIISEHRKYLLATNIDVNPQFIRRTFQRWGWNYATPEVKQIQKYYWANLIYYARFVHHVAFLPANRIKYFDESHFEHKLLKNVRALRPIGEVKCVITSSHLDVRASLMLMTTLTAGNCTSVIDISSNTTDAMAFLKVNSL